ncbi:MAG: hypothetical protein IJ887_14200 [Prevotella sp.]|nr:hypothetical protein [Prevotella sp.]
MRNFFDLLGSNARIVVALALCGLGTSNAVAQGERSDYIPFVEEGKVWYCGADGNIGRITPEHPEGEGIVCVFTIHGDTLINGREYKKVCCQYDDYYGDKDQHYYCAVREEACLVFIVEEKMTEEKLLYDFSRPEEEITTLTYNNQKFARTEGWRLPGFCPGQMMYAVCIFSGDEIDYSNAPGFWVDGVGAPGTNPFAFEFSNHIIDKPKLGKYIFVRTCMKDGKYIFKMDWMVLPGDPEWQCATPTIAYDNGRLVFGCETPDVEYIYEIKCTDAVSGRGSEVSLGQTYEIRVHATLDGYEDSDVAVATIGWRNGRPVMEGFSSVTLGDSEGISDVNGDGKVDVADIATIIDIMAGQKE